MIWASPGTRAGIQPAFIWENAQAETQWRFLAGKLKTKNVQP